MHRRTWRERRLASDRRAGSWVRGNVRRTQYAYLRRNWVPHVVVTAVAWILILAGSSTLPWDYVRGLTVGVAGTTIVAMQWVWIVQATGTAALAMGDQAEQWTAAVLRKLPGRRVVNHVKLRQTDIDHVVVGPDGLYAVETKWRSAPITSEWTVHVARQATRNAKDLTLWSETRPYGPARPVVIIWGPSSRDLSAGTSVDGVPFLIGSDASTWWDSAAGKPPVLTADDIDSAWQRLAQRCAATDPLEEAIPPSPLDIALLGFAVTILGVVSFLVTAALPAWLPIGWAAAVAVASLVGGIAVRRQLASRARYLATAWVTGTVAGLCPIGVALIASR